MSSTIEPWTEAFRVRSDEITPHGVASVPTLCSYLQEAAGHHADALGVSIQRLHANDQAWVLAHLRVEINRLPRWEEVIIVETWPSGIERIYATREFVLRGENGTIARATSAWVVFDLDNRRPARPPRALNSIDPPDRPPAAPHDWNDLPHPEQTMYGRTFDVRYHDLDVNRHVNNVHVLEWALETLPVEVHESYRCTQVALQFVGETQHGDSVQATAHVEEEGTDLHVRHALQHMEDGRTLTVAQTQWTPRSDSA